MFTVKISTMSPHWPLLRQTPGRLGVWGDCRFVLNEPIEECDFWVVCDGLPATESVRCPPGNTLLITAEPPSVKRYARDFVRQFDRVISCHRNLRHTGVTVTQQALQWMVGGRYDRARRVWSQVFTKDYDELHEMAFPVKDRMFSVIVSNKAMTPGHHLRVKFVERLLRHFGDQVHVYGAAGRDLADKWDGIARYRYHLVMENSVYPDYWTEKLADAFLGGAFPFYHGCPNVGDYFPPDSLLPIDIRKPDAAIAAMERAMAENRFQACRDAVWSARSLVLDRYNLFAMVARIVEESSARGGNVPTVLHPERHSPLLSKCNRFKNWLIGEGVS